MDSVNRSFGIISTPKETKEAKEVQKKLEHIPTKTPSEKNVGIHDARSDIIPVNARKVQKQKPPDNLHSSSSVDSSQHKTLKGILGNKPQEQLQVRFADIVVEKKIPYPSKISTSEPTQNARTSTSTSTSTSTLSTTSTSTSTTRTDDMQNLQKTHALNKAEVIVKEKLQKGLEPMLLLVKEDILKDIKPQDQDNIKKILNSINLRPVPDIINFEDKKFLCNVLTCLVPLANEQTLIENLQKCGIPEKQAKYVQESIEKYYVNIPKHFEILGNLNENEIKVLRDSLVASKFNLGKFSTDLHKFIDTNRTSQQEIQKQMPEEHINMEMDKMNKIVQDQIKDLREHILVDIPPKSKDKFLNLIGIEDVSIIDFNNNKSTRQVLGGLLRSVNSESFENSLVAIGIKANQSKFIIQTIKGFNETIQNFFWQSEILKKISEGDINYLINEFVKSNLNMDQLRNNLQIAIKHSS